MTRRQEALDALASAPKDLRRMARRLEGLSGPDAPKLLAMIVMHERKTRAIIQKMAGEKTFQPARPEPELGVPPQSEAAYLIQTFEMERRNTIGILSALSMAAWQRKSKSGDGTTTIREVVQMLIAKDTDMLGRLVMFYTNPRL